ncbi:hypothetical protein EA658_09860 [Pseudoxanthomonas winnipegensis]|uniref:Uncharacterized protein n=1 Tax=Pseudoxanthomonas winnipegensis TaxID=2480810 RepID=A0ABY1WCR6_9GAMM|nr:hypothetical protein [Pseudoxanthomonas winnipegensis]TAA12460.1 hypothetical protein EA659_03790 [Pseudoxanthomonas winnipegensis]TAA19175.1 hypothetical protein EA658_09860 [Pseudoxanthomonas winnipegensis]TAH70436.1 hypothetical protein EA657_16925 [Pseudoxanthomonas winnipegensis]
MPRSNGHKDAIKGLQHALSLIDTRNARPTAGLLESLRSMVSDALEIIREPDPTTRSALLAVAMLVDSTEVSEVVRSGKKITRIKITDQWAYNWAMARIHQLAAGK